MAVERTYVMLKPDALQRGIAGQIIARIERRGYRIATMKTMQLDEAILREHYAHIANQPYFPATVEYMTSGPVAPPSLRKPLPAPFAAIMPAAPARTSFTAPICLGLPGRRSCAFSGRRGWPEPKAVHFAGTA